MSEDRFDLLRFVEAQNTGDAYVTALLELRAGRKRGHWIWYVFPQLIGLGSSPTSRRYGINSLAEAAAYLEHPVLGPRLRECSEALLELSTDDPEAVLGGVDVLKLRSSMTLFARVPSATPVFRRVLERYYDGAADPATDRLLAEPSRQS